MTAPKMTARVVTVAEVRMPFGMKQAERAPWVAARTAEFEAQGCTVTVRRKQGHVFVIAKRAEQVVARVQIRGVCQGCGGSVAVEGGRTSLHGYNRPGTGYTVGRCLGAQRTPANGSLDLTHSILESLDRQATEAEAQVPALEAAYEACGKYTAARSEAYVALRNAKQSAQAARDYAAHLRATAVPALGTDLAEVLL